MISRIHSLKLASWITLEESRRLIGIANDASLSKRVGGIF